MCEYASVCECVWVCERVCVSARVWADGAKRTQLVRVINVLRMCGFFYCVRVLSTEKYAGDDHTLMDSSWWGG